MSLLITSALGQNADEGAEIDPEVMAGLADAAATLEPTAQKLWPTTFAGVWLGEGGIRDAIFVAFTEGADEKVAALAEAFPEPGLLRAVDAEETRAELEARQERMRADRARASAGAINLEGVPGGRYALGLDIPANAPVVYLEDANATAAAEFRALYGRDVIVKEAARPEPVECFDRVFCIPGLRSGLGVSFAATQSASCSTAFTVRLPSAARGILSAGHCGGFFEPDIDELRFHASLRYGRVLADRFGGRVDAELHSINDDFNGRPFILRNLQSKEWEVRSVSSWAGVIVGEDVCKAGIRHNPEQCGTITDKDYIPTGTDFPSDANRYIKADGMCVEGGDSGSGVFGMPGEGAGHRAYGIISGRSDAACPDPARYSIFPHIQYTEEEFGVQVLTTAPEVPSFGFTFGSFGAGAGEFELPRAIDVGPSGSVWVTDYGNGRVQWFNADGTYLGQFGNRDWLDGTSGVAVDSGGAVWVTAAGPDALYKVVPPFDRSNATEIISPVGFSDPSDVEVDANNNVWVVDHGNHRIQKFDSNGTFIDQFGSHGSTSGKFAGPTGIALDSDGNVWVADHGNDRIQKFDPHGAFIAAIGSTGSGPGELWGPWDVDLDGAGQIWVTDTFNARVQKFAPNGDFLAEFGNFGDGEGQFSFPYGIEVDAGRHNTWIVEFGNDRVQNFSCC